MSEFGLRAPRTIEEAIKDIAEWKDHATKFPDLKRIGGITISTELLQDICDRIIALETKNGSHE